jgi:RHS repeat-associated protein
MLSCSPSLLEFAHRQPAGSANSHSRRQTRKNAAFAGGCTPVKADSQRGCGDPRSKLAQGTTNHLYSVAAITNTAGQVVERYSYNAYGVRSVKNPANVVIAKSVVGNDRGFTSYKLDAETGLYAARARMYSARLGRFITRDPLRLSQFFPKAGDGYQDGVSLFAAYFSPNGLDPSGMSPGRAGTCDKKDTPDDPCLAALLECLKRAKQDYDNGCTDCENSAKIQEAVLVASAVFTIFATLGVGAVAVGVGGGIAMTGIVVEYNRCLNAVDRNYTIAKARCESDYQQCKAGQK